MANNHETDPRLLDALASLNQIGAAINRISLRDVGRVDATLRLIVESAIEVLPGASAVIYTYAPEQGEFDLNSRVSAGEPGDYQPNDAPRPEGIGARSIRERRRVLSYEEPDLEIHPDKVHAGAQAMACFPLVVAYQPVGVLYVYLNQDRAFTQLELLMLEVFVNQAAMAIYQARRVSGVQRDLARKEEELARLRRAGLLISSRLRLEETLEAILQMALEVTGAGYGIFRLLDDSGQHLVARAIAGEQLARPQVDTLPLDNTSVMGWVALHREPVCIHDLQAAPWVQIYQPLDAELTMRAELAVPLIGASGRLEGVLNLESPVIGAFDEADRHLMQSLATQAVIAIQEVRLLDALLEAARLLLDQPFHRVLERLVAMACDLLNATASAVWTLEGDQLVLQTASAGFRRGERLPVADSLTGEAILARQVVLAADVRDDPRFHLPDLAHAQNWAGALIVPLATEQDHEPVGAFSVYSDEPDRFAESEWDEKVLSCLAHYAALAVQNRAHQERLREVQERHAVAETFAAVGDVAANVLHHLNNKVGTIPVRVQGLRAKSEDVLAGEPYLQKNLDEIERSAVEALEAVRENLIHLRPIRLAPVDVGDCISAALKMVEVPDGVTLTCEGVEGLPPVQAGMRSLMMVFTNLLENAVEALQGTGTILIRGALHDRTVQVAVTDNGPGIEPELQDHIFEFNFSGRRSTRPSIGFGLWWVKTLMVRLGGSIRVESDGRQGTTFYLQLPAVEEAA